jgi:hypothetical protein
MNYIFQLVLTLGLFVLTADSPAQRPSRGPGGGGTGKRVMPEDLKFEDGVATIPDRAAFEKISYQGSDVKRDRYLAGVEFVKFIVDEPGSEKPILYFMNTKNHRAHPPYMGMVGIQDHGIPRGALTYLPRLKAPNGEAGLYTIDFQPYDSYSCEQIQTILTILTAKMPILKGRVAFHPLSGNLDLYEREKGKYVAAGIAVHLDSDLYRNIAYLPLNEAESFGLLRVMKNDGRPSPRDIVIYQTLPNQMPRVAGVITEVSHQTVPRQTGQPQGDGSRIQTARGYQSRGGSTFRRPSTGEKSETRSRPARNQDPSAEGTQVREFLKLRRQGSEPRDVAIAAVPQGHGSSRIRGSVSFLP